MKKQLIAFLLVGIITLGCTFISSPGYAEPIYRINGNHGFVASEYLEAISKPDRSGSFEAKVVLNDTSSHLNVRSGPSTDDKIIDTLKHGQKVTVYIDRNVPKGWSKITY